MVAAPPNTGKTLTTMMACMDYGAKFLAEDLAITDGDGLKVSAADEGTITATVGSGAGSIGWFGGSIGVSLAEITNNDQVVAEIEKSQITTGTSGSPVKVTATDSVTLNTLSVATSLSISIGAAGAGGNSNISSYSIITGP